MNLQKYLQIFNEPYIWALLLAWVVLASVFVNGYFKLHRRITGVKPPERIFPYIEAGIGFILAVIFYSILRTDSSWSQLDAAFRITGLIAIFYAALIISAYVPLVSDSSKSDLKNFLTAIKALYTDPTRRGGDPLVSGFFASLIILTSLIYLNVQYREWITANIKDAALNPSPVLFGCFIPYWLWYLFQVPQSTEKQTEQGFHLWQRIQYRLSMSWIENALLRFPVKLVLVFFFTVILLGIAFTLNTSYYDPSFEYEQFHRDQSDLHHLIALGIIHR